MKEEEFYSTSLVVEGRPRVLYVADPRFGFTRARYLKTTGAIPQWPVCKQPRAPSWLNGAGIVTCGTFTTEVSPRMPLLSGV